MIRRRRKSSMTRARAQKSYRERQSTEGLKQLNVVALTKLHSRLKKLVKAANETGSLSDALASVLPKSTKAAAKKLARKQGAR
jgi:hypothetical protein